MKMTLMGTGTSHGVPVIGCRCKVCRSLDEKDSRLRCSALISGPADVLVDITPEFRIQALRHGISRLDAVFLTHSHADHLHGIDDLRVFSHSRPFDPFNRHGSETEGEGLPVYSGRHTIEDIKFRFDYIFKYIGQGGGKPKLNTVCADSFDLENPITVGSLKVLQVPLKHGYLDDSGWLFMEEKDHGSCGSIAYLTDVSFVPEESFCLIRDAVCRPNHLVIDGLRILEHSTHFSFEQALAAADRINPRNVYLTHITHNLFHWQVQEFVDAIIGRYPNLLAARKAGGYVGPAWDGLVLEC